jgi:hypothetical protein
MSHNIKGTKQPLVTVEQRPRKERHGKPINRKTNTLMVARESTLSRGKKNSPPEGKVKKEKIK